MPEIENKVSLGHLIQLGAILFALAVGYQTINGRTQAHEEAIVDHETRVRLIEARISDTLGRLEIRLEQIEARLTRPE